MLPAFGAPHEMRWHLYVQYLNMPSINAWHLRHLPQAIKRFHCFIAVQYYHSRQHREWQIILICRKRYGTTDSPGPCPGLHPQIGMQHKNVFKHFYGILVSGPCGIGRNRQDCCSFPALSAGRQGACQTELFYGFAGSARQSSSPPPRTVSPS